MRNKIRSAVSLFTYLFSKKTVVTVADYWKLTRALSTLRQERLISYWPHTSFLNTYLSRSLNDRQKYEALLNHYAFLLKKIPLLYLKQLFLNDLECLKISGKDCECKIILKKNIVKESEGPLSLCLTVNGALISTMSFSFLPGHILGCPGENMLFISHSQRAETPKDNNEKFLSSFIKIHPSAILLKAMEGISLALGLNTIVAITALNQLSNSPEKPQASFNAAYDDLWEARGGRRIHDNYIFNLPLKEIPIIKVKQKHRNKTLKRRNLLNNISLLCFNNFDKIVLK